MNRKNCINLEDVIHKHHLVSACVFSFFIGQEELFDHLPLTNLSDDVPVSFSHTPISMSMRLISNLQIYIGRDANMGKTNRSSALGVHICSPSLNTILLLRRYGHAWA